MSTRAGSSPFSSEPDPPPFGVAALPGVAAAVAATPTAVVVGGADAGPMVGLDGAAVTRGGWDGGPPDGGEELVGSGEEAGAGVGVDAGTPDAATPVGVAVAMAAVEQVTVIVAG